MSERDKHSLPHDRGRRPAAMISPTFGRKCSEEEKAAGATAAPTSRDVILDGGIDVEVAQLPESSVDGVACGPVQDCGRPHGLKSSLQEICFVISVAGSQLMTEYYISGMALLVRNIRVQLQMSTSEATWPLIAFSLSLSTFLLPFGRLSDIYGGARVYFGGLIWLCVLSLAAGFSKNAVTLIILRALQGLGPAALLPSGVKLICSFYTPGPRINVVFAVYGACAPLGFFVGILLASVSNEFLRWQWYFWLGAILAGFLLLTTMYAIGGTKFAEQRGSTDMDWLGLMLVVPCLTLTLFAITIGDAFPGQWGSPVRVEILITGVVFTSMFVYVEGWIAKSPMIPYAKMGSPNLKAVLLDLFLGSGCIGIFIQYTNLYFQSTWHVTQMKLVAWYCPLIFGGITVPIVCSLFLHRAPATAIFMLAGIAWFLAPLFVAISPATPDYWAFALPAMLCFSLGVELPFIVSSVFITSCFDCQDHGFVGALINSASNCAIAIFLGLAAVVESATNSGSVTDSPKYRPVFWFQMGVAGVALLVVVAFVRIGRVGDTRT